jgi:hypothetical protein
MTPEERRLTILRPEHQPFACPDQGRVMLLPYVSHAAFAAFLARRDDPRAAFLALAEQSLAGGPPVTHFSEADCDAIARFYAETMDCLEAYDVAKTEHGVYGALRAAFASTQLWKSYLEDERRFTAQLHWSTPSLIRDVTREMRTLDDALQHIRRIVPDDLFRAPVLSLPVQSVLLDMRSHVLLPRIDAIADLARVATRNMDAWQHVLRQHDEITRSARAFAESTRWMTQLTDQLGQMQRLLRPVPDITGMLRAAGEQLRSTGFAAETLFRADVAIARSIDVVVGANDYFSRREGTVSPVVRPVLPLDAPPDSREAFDTVADSAAAAEGLLHDESSGLVVLGSEAAQLIADLVKEGIDERLRPYGNILSRLERIARPGTFLDLLSAFATVTARDYWKALWHKPGEAYLPSPERLAQTFLGLFLNGAWGGLAFVGREIGNGDGYVDLLVNFLGQDHVVELKMLGGSYGIGHAKGGLDQLDAYMQNYQSPEAFLVVFDGRKTQHGEQLQATYDLPHGRVRVVTVRVYFDAPSR